GRRHRLAPGHERVAREPPLAGEDVTRGEKALDVVERRFSLVGQQVVAETLTRGRDETGHDGRIGVEDSRSRGHLLSNAAAAVGGRVQRHVLVPAPTLVPVGVTIRPAVPSDYDRIAAVVDDWWGRPLRQALPRLFLDHFHDTSFVAEDGDELC